MVRNFLEGSTDQQQVGTLTGLLVRNPPLLLSSPTTP
jgi:hypothetical protein